MRRTPWIPKSGAEVFRHRGAKMVCVWARPEGAGRRFPAVLLLHGVPGSEKNVDLSRALLKKGIASLTLHFRGAWGSGGLYRFSRLVDDARAGLRFLARRPGTDPRRLAVFGFSMGGWTAIHLGALEPRVRAVCAVAPVGGSEMVRSGTRGRIARLARPLNAGPAGALFRDFVRSLRRFDPARNAARLKCPLLLVHGTEDELVPLAVSRRIHASARAAGAASRLVEVPGARHDFLDRRERLVRLVAGWLERMLRP